MSDGFQFLDIVFFALIAIFLILRLRAVLGRRTGNERPRGDIFGRGEHAAEPPGKVVRMPERAGSAPRELPREPQEEQEEEAESATRTEAPTSPASRADLRAGLTEVRVADPSFDSRGFLGGARAAYGIIINAVAKGDSATLRPLLGDELYDRYVEAIRQRLKEGQVLTMRLVAIDSLSIESARMNGRTAEIGVRIVARLDSTTTDKDGKTIAGNPNEPTRTDEYWLFTRNTRSRDPNWSLIETRSDG